MQLKSKEMEKVFSKLRMVVKQKHHKNAYFYYQGKMIFKTRASHGRKEIPKSVVEQTINQFYLKKDQFIALKNCPLSYDDFVNILKEKGYIT